MDGKMAGPAAPRLPRFGSGANGPLIGWHHPGNDTPQLFGDRAKVSRRIIPAFWLAFLALPLSATFRDPHVGTGHVAVVVVLIVVFAVAYLTLMAVPDSWSAAVPPAVWAGVVLLFPTVATFLSFYDRGAWAYCFTFSLWPAAWVVRSRVLVVVGFTVWTAVVGAASGLGGSDLFSAVVIVFGVGCTFLGFWRLLEANEALRQAQADQARIAVAEERLRFSRDLHDLLGHSLSVITLKSEVAARLLPGRPEQAAGEVAEIEHVARQALWEVREAVSGYRRTTLATDLIAARTALAAASMTATLDIAELGLVPAIVAVLAWAVREGVTTVVRHSHARTCT
ncbi:MAG: sensor histidine kinase, partial [Acidimicrobiales bacterium]